VKGNTKIRGEKEHPAAVQLFWSSALVKSLRNCLEVLQKGKQILAVTGEIGSGKTELRNLLAEGLIDAGYNIVSFDIPGSLSSLEMLQILGGQLNFHLNVESKISLLEQFVQHFSSLTPTFPLLIFIDECDKLTSTEFLGDLKFLANATNGLFIYFFGRTSFLKLFAEIFSYYEERTALVELGILSDKEARNFLNWLEAEYFVGKTRLPDWTKNYILELAERNPGKIKMLAKLAYEELSAHQASFKEAHLNERWASVKKYFGQSNS